MLIETTSKRRRRTGSSLVCTRRLACRFCPPRRWRFAGPTARSFKTPPSVTARSMRYSRPSSESRASAPTSASSWSAACPGERRPGRSDARARSRKRRPRIPRPGSLDRYHRSIGPGYINAVNAIATHKERGHVARYRAAGGRSMNKKGDITDFGPGVPSHIGPSIQSRIAA